MAFFLYRDGYEIKRTKGDYEIAFHLHDEGYELFSRPLFTDQEVATEQRAWQERVDKMREQDASDNARLNLSFLGRGAGRSEAEAGGGITASDTRQNTSARALSQNPVR